MQPKRSKPEQSDLMEVLSATELSRIASFRPDFVYQTVDVAAASTSVGVPFGMGNAAGRVGPPARFYGGGDAANVYGSGEVGLREEIAGLKKEIRRLADSIDSLSRAVSPAPEPEVSPRELSAAQAREEIISFLTGRDAVYPSDIAQALELDYELVVDTLASLRQEGLAMPSKGAKA